MRLFKQFSTYFFLFLGFFSLYCAGGSTRVPIKKFFTDCMEVEEDFQNERFCALIDHYFAFFSKKSELSKKVKAYHKKVKEQGIALLEAAFEEKANAPPIPYEVPMMAYEAIGKDMQEKMHDEMCLYVDILEQLVAIIRVDYKGNFTKALKKKVGQFFEWLLKMKVKEKVKASKREIEKNIKKCFPNGGDSLEGFDEDITKKIKDDHKSAIDKANQALKKALEELITKQKNQEIEVKEIIFGNFDSEKNEKDSAPTISDSSKGNIFGLSRERSAEKEASDKKLNQLQKRAKMQRKKIKKRKKTKSMQWGMGTLFLFLSFLGLRKIVKKEPDLSLSEEEEDSKKA